MFLTNLSMTKPAHGCSQVGTAHYLAATRCAWPRYEMYRGAYQDMYQGHVPYVPLHIPEKTYMPQTLVHIRVDLVRALGSCPWYIFLVWSWHRHRHMSQSSVPKRHTNRYDPENDDSIIYSPGFINLNGSIPVGP